MDDVNKLLRVQTMCQTTVDETEGPCLGTTELTFQLAMEMKERTTQNVRLKLNSDKKTISGTRLLHALYLYIQNKEAVKETDYLEFVKNYTNFKKLIEIVPQLTGVLCILF